MADGRFLLLALDITAPGLDIEALGGVLAGDRRITSWWNHLPGVFLLTTRLQPGDITDLVRTLAGNTGFLVTEIDLARTDGWLTDTAWRWIGRQVAGRAADLPDTDPHDAD